MKKEFITWLISLQVFTQPLATVQARETGMLAYRGSTHLSGTTATPDFEVRSHKSHVGVYVRAKVMRTFLQYFEDATEVHWNLSENRYLASFKNEGRLSKALFALNGNLLYYIRYGTEKDLPHDVRRSVKSLYPEHTIGTVSEVDSNNRKAWMVNLEDADNLVVVRVTDSRVEELHHYKTHF
jgi:hypothetical protein